MLCNNMVYFAHSFKNILQSMPIYVDASNKAEPPANLLPWLLHVQSLSQKLKTAAGDASLEVLGQRWGNFDAWDAVVLGLQTSQVLHREIIMKSWGVPCWYARTILPIETYTANASLFDRLKTEPLGDLIFKGSVIKRSSITHYSIDENSMEYAWLADEIHQHTAELWTRLSEFTVCDAHSFFLLEILLPGLARYCN